MIYSIMMRYRVVERISVFSLWAEKDHCGDASRAFKLIIVLAGLLASAGAQPALAVPVLQCVTYAKAVSGIELDGDANT